MGSDNSSNSSNISSSSMMNSSWDGGLDLSGLSSAKWSLEYEKGATEQWTRITLACVLAIWIPVWLSWCYVVFYRKSERGFKVRGG